MKSATRFIPMIVALSIGLTLTLGLCAMFGRPVRADPGVIYVDADAPGSTHDGLSWTTAFTNVQSAFAVATSGDEIWVAEGVYYPDEGPGQTDNDRASTFTLKPGVERYGGFAATETLRSQRDWTEHITVLSGDIDQNDATDPYGVVTTTTAINGNNAYHVVSSSSGVTETAVIDGFTITAGQANGASPDHRGGGMFNDHSSPTLTNITFSGNTASEAGGGMGNDYSSPTLTNVTFSGNTANSYGGGMYNTNSSPTLTNVSFSGNQAMWGGGMYNTHSSPTLTNVTFSGNTAGIGGGGMGNDYSSPTLMNVTFSGNTAPSYGGGMYNGWYNNPTLTDVTFNGNTTGQLGGGMFNQWSSPTLTDVTFNGNQAGELGGGMFNWWGSNPTLTNVTFSGNTATNYGGGMYNQSYSSPTLTNVTFSGNTANSYGGGMYSYYYCNPTLANVTFSSNSADYGGGIYNTDDSNPTLVNTILWGNTALSGGNQVYNISGSTPVISYSDIQGSGGSGAGWDGALGTDGGGNIDADPLFVSAPANLRLQVTSPAIDAGNNAAVPSGVTADLDGNPRFVDIPAVPDTGNGTPPIVDMGAYEANWVDVSIVKTVLLSEVAPGQPITFTLAFSNGGSITATHVVITDSVPDFLSVTLVVSAGVAITDTGHVPLYVWAVQDLTPGQGGVITLMGVLTAPLAAGTYTNTAVITADADAWVGNNTAVVTFTVPNVPPYFTSTPVTNATQDAPYTYAVTAADHDLIYGDTLTLTAPTLPAWLALTDHGNGTATLSGTPSNADVGDHAVVLRVTDSSGLYATQSFTITVANVNDAPAFTSTTVTTATQDAPYTYAVTTADPDLIHGDTLTLTAPTLPAWLTLTDHGDGTATLSGTPSNADVGDYAVVLRVTDSSGLYATQSFTITVVEKPWYRIYLPLALRNTP